MPRLRSGLALALTPALVAFGSALAQHLEPSEAQMRAAVERWFDDLHAQYRDMAQACVGPVQNRTLPPDICARICSSPSSCQSPFELRNFRKGNCQPPAADGQVRCSFAADVITANPAMRDAGRQSEGLFAPDGETWRFFRLPGQ